MPLMGNLGSPDTNQLRAPAQQACLKARDAFYACLEKDLQKEVGSEGLMNPVDYNKARSRFENSCPTFWVKHFDSQYCKDKRVQRQSNDKTTRERPLSLTHPYTFEKTTTAS